MPKSRGRDGARQRAGAATDTGPQTQSLPSNPSWFVPIMCGLMILGVLWVATFYITAGNWPVGDWGYWNLGIGMGLIMAGFVMATRWR
ncbi:cell division protein CrgA [Ornithinimicrobium pratense]|uniref:Cell division protein CrgA n=1 Tax=Ornithinimicrobium pratense TaxID=2593973 RepID=A0A5J6V1D3_9MICO|nr:cell division protein CrgA [Ornithinimicrobium pratense]QFG67365.1 cell division protein CrgA [Ornithinimicrobium pratense]